MMHPHMQLPLSPADAGVIVYRVRGKNDTSKLENVRKRRAQVSGRIDAAAREACRVVRLRRLGRRG